jgi:hypothetical protein
MLLHGDGTNGAQNNTFLDSSTNNFTITRNGNTTQGSFSPYGSNWSNYFDQLSYFFVGTNSAYNFSSGSWTYECWINLTGTSPTGYYTVFSNGYPIQLYVTNNAFEVYIGTSNGSGGQIVNGQRTSAGSVPVGSWVHFALVRNSANSTYKMYVNGVEQASTTSATDPVASTFNFTLPAFGPAPFGFTQPFLGYISNFRATASAVYTSNFTPSTTPLTAISGTGLLTCADNRFIDDSTNNFAISLGSGNPIVQRFNPFGTSTAYSTSVIGGSGYFDGSGDTLDVPTSSANAIGTSSFCIEAWIYMQNSSAQQFLVANASSGGLWIGFNIDAANKLAIGRVATAIDNEVSYTWVNGQWYHVAVNRSGTSLQFFVNGVQVGSTGSNSVNYSNQGYRVGSETTQKYFTGYMTDFRLTRDSVYTTTFTPSTTPLTAITNTAVLLNMTNGAIFDNAMMNNLETVGNAQISTSVVKYGTGSMYFDGTGDYLQVPSSPNYIFTGDYTIEMWLYVPTGYFQTIQRLVSSASASPAGACYFSLGNDNGIGAGYLCAAVNLTSPYNIPSGNPLLWSSTLFPVATWTHVALVRSGSTVKIYQGGVSVASVTNTVTWNFNNSAGLRISGTNWEPTTENLQGYIDDLRITNGYARYTTTFTPPTAAFPNIGPV